MPSKYNFGRAYYLIDQRVAAHSLETLNGKSKSSTRDKIFMAPEHIYLYELTELTGS